MKFASHYDNSFIANACIHELKMAPNLDLSFLEGHSVNDGILKSPFSLQYVHVIVDSFIHTSRLVAETQLWLRSMWHMLIEMWQSGVDRVVLIGLRLAAPFILKVIEDMVEGTLVHDHGVDFLPLSLIRVTEPH